MQYQGSLAAHCRMTTARNQMWPPFRRTFNVIGCVKHVITGRGAGFTHTGFNPVIDDHEQKVAFRSA